MIKNIKYYGLIIVQLLVLLPITFASFRIIFIILYWGKIQFQNPNFSEIIHAFIAAFSLDFAFSAGSILLFIWVFLLLHSIFKQYFPLIFAKIAVLLVGFIYLLIDSIQLGIYNEWEEKPGFEILTYLHHPAEAFYSAPLQQFLLLSTILIIAYWLFFKATNYIFSNKKYPNKSWVFITIFSTIAPILLLVIARGGTQQIPISQSDAYYSKHKILNDIAINTQYNFIHSITQNYQIIAGNNPYKTGAKQAQIQKIIKPYLNQNCTAPRILNNKQPNIILVIMESFSGYFIKEQQQVIPNFMNLAKNGILFNNIYGSGTLSHEGIPAILSGWPAIDNLYITNLPKKFNKLPSITEKLKQKKYKSLFMFGGDLNYGNLKSYIYKNQFDKILAADDIKELLPNVKPGVLSYHDKPTLQLLLDLTDKTKQPFFNTIFTASSHSPYDQPLQNKIKFGGEDQPYFNSVYYTDQAIGEFIDNAKTKSWYKNTLFVFVSDHSHHVPKNFSRNDARWHQIAMLFYGDVIKKSYQGKIINKITSQHDVATTLLNQLNINSDEFEFSRNIFCNNYQEGSYYMINGGYGFITPNGNYAYNFRLNREVHNIGKINPLIGHYYLENLFNNILNK